MPSKRSLKIFVDAYLLNKEPQGTQTYIRELYKEVIRQHPESRFFFGVLNKDSISASFLSFENVELLEYKRKSRVWRMLFEIPRLIRDKGFDYAHFQYVIPISRSKTCKYLVTIHDVLFLDFPRYFSWTYRLMRQKLFKYSAQKADYLLTVSQYSKQAIERQYQLGNKEVYLIPNGVSDHLFEAYDKQAAIDRINAHYGIKNYLLYVSRVEPRKNHELLLKLFIDKALYEKYELVFVGKKSLRNIHLEAYFQALSEEQKNRVHQIEYVSDKDLAAFYKAARLFVFPSKCEGFGLPPLEAAAYKIPVLCSDQTAMSDFGFFYPYFVDPNDTDAFSNAFDQVMSMEDLEHLDGVQQTVKKQYSWEHSAMKLSKLFNCD